MFAATSAKSAVSEGLNHVPVDDDPTDQISSAMWEPKYLKVAAI
jgi:hypothetical protein